MESDFKKQKKRNPKSRKYEAKGPEVEETSTVRPALSKPASPVPEATKLEEIKVNDWWDYHR